MELCVHDHSRATSSNCRMQNREVVPNLFEATTLFEFVNKIACRVYSLEYDDFLKNDCKIF